MKSIFLSALSLFLIFFLAILTIGIFLPSKPLVEVKVELENSNKTCIYQQIINLKMWDKWSVWNQLDTNMIKTYSEQTVGTGAFYTWKGNSKVGSGRLEITKSVSDQLIEMKLDFEGMNTTYSTVTLDDQYIIWSMPVLHSSNSIVKFLFGGYQYLLMKHFLTQDFEGNIQNLKKNCK